MLVLCPVGMSLLLFSCCMFLPQMSMTDLYGGANVGMDMANPLAAGKKCAVYELAVG